jgi:vesicle-fusing ATPase
MEGLEDVSNFLVIGMTNRKDLIDSALLRPGRFEVQIEIGLPDEEGRLQILKIHAKNLLDNDKLHNDISLEEFAKKTKNFSGAELGGIVIYLVIIANE